MQENDLLTGKIQIEKLKIYQRMENIRKIENSGKMSKNGITFNVHEWMCVMTQTYFQNLAIFGLFYPFGYMKHLGFHTCEECRNTFSTFGTLKNQLG